jgi:opacity protein-like surface antigen
MRSVIRKLAIAAALFLAAAGAPRPARATGYLDHWHPYQTYWAIAWQAAVPVLDLNQGFVGAPSWVGGAIAVRVGVLPRVAVGVAGDWNWFTDTVPFGVVERPDYTITGPSYRRLATYSVLGTLHWYMTQTAVQPYVGVGVGAVWFDTRVQSVDVKDSSAGVALAVAPEAGILFTIVPRFGFYASGTYHWTQATLYGVKNAQWVGAQLGAAYYF